MLNAAETAGVAESDSSAGSCCRSLLSDGGSPATVNLGTRSVRGEARRNNSQGWKIAVANRRRPEVLRAVPAVHKWPVGSIPALRLSPECSGCFISIGEMNTLTLLHVSLRSHCASGPLIKRIQISRTCHGI